MLLPVVKERSPNVVQLSAREFTMNSPFNLKLKCQITSSLVPRHDKSVFYTGTIPGEEGPISVLSMVEEYADKHNKETLGRALERGKIDMALADISVWIFASEVYAEKSSGVVHAVIGKWVKEGNVYHTIEKPALLKNPRVTTLIEHNVETWEATVVK